MWLCLYFFCGIVTAIGLCIGPTSVQLLKSTFVKVDDIFAFFIEFVNMQLAHRHDERPGESYMALDGKKGSGSVSFVVSLLFLVANLAGGLALCLFRFCLFVVSCGFTSNKPLCSLMSFCSG